MDTFRLTEEQLRREELRDIMLVPVPKDPVEAMHGMLKDGPSLTADLLEERARGRGREVARDCRKPRPMAECRSED